MFSQRAVPLAALCAAVLCAAPAGAQPCATDVCVKVVPSSLNVPVGGTFTLDIRADFNVPIVGWGFDVAFDTPGILSLDPGAVFGPGWFQGFAPDGDGLAGLAFPNGIMGNDLLLLQLSFDADAVGDTNVLISVTAGDVNEGFAKDPSGFASMTLNSGHVTVVPEPATLALFAAAALSSSRRRR